MPDAGRTASRRATGLWWLALVTAVAVVLGVAGLGITVLTRKADQPTPEVPVPATPTPTTTGAGPAVSSSPQTSADPVVVRRPTRAGLLPGGGAGDIYAQTATAVFRLELATGRVTLTPTPRLEAFNSFVAGPDWVVSKTVDDGTGVIVRHGERASPLPALLQTPGRLNPGPGGHLWLQPEPPNGPADTISLVSVDGHRVPGQTRRLDTRTGDYIFGSDAAGYLLQASAGGVYQVSASATRRISRGVPVAVSRDRLLVWDCDATARCDPQLLDRSSGRVRRIPQVKAALLKLLGPVVTGPAGELSSDGRFAAVTYPSPDATNSLSVVDLETGRVHPVPGALTDTNANAQVVWTPNGRWLLAITDHRIRAVNPYTGATRTLSLDDDPVLHLTTLGAAG